MLRQSVILIFLGLLIVISILNIFSIQTILQKANFNNKIRSNVKNYMLNSKKQSLSPYDINNNLAYVQSIQEKIQRKVNTLPSRYYNRNQRYKYELQKISMQLNEETNSIINITDKVTNWPSSDQLIPSDTPELGQVIRILRNLKIVAADNAHLGTQLKLMVTFENGLKAIFKPQWYTRTTKIRGLVYHGKDRHNAEVVAFYLALLLSFRRVPLTLIRKLNLDKEIKKNATPDLLATFFKNNNDDICFYGICHYCSASEPVCGTPNILEGSIILWLPPNSKLTKYKHPWQRTYIKSTLARWEYDMNYCKKIQRSKIYSVDSRRLLDLVDVAIFDFLIDNGDRHHYEILKDKNKSSAVLLIDNGKSLGNPDNDHIDILAPLYQCCIIRKSTWERLQLFSGGSISYALNDLLAHESSKANVLPLITTEHLNAIERRLLTVFAVVEFCIEKNQYPDTIIL